MSEPLPKNAEEPDEEVRTEAEENRENQPENSSLQRQISASVQFTGPLPPPISLEHYNRILPGAANRVFSMAEREQEHRHKMQEKLVDAQILDAKQERIERKRGQDYGLIIGVLTVFASCATTLLGHPWVGGALGSAGIIGLVSVFVYGRREQQSNQYPQLKSSDIEDETGSI